MSEYMINANLKTEIFQKDYVKNVLFICKTVDYIENKEAIDNYYFYSHGKYFRLTEYKDHVNCKIYITDEEMDKFDLKKYTDDYKRIYALPAQDKKLTATGMIYDNVNAIKHYINDHFNDTQINKINTTLNHFIIVEEGKITISDYKLPIAIICSYPRYKYDSQKDFESLLEIPIKAQNLDDKINEYKKNTEKIFVSNKYYSRMEKFF